MLGFVIAARNIIIGALLSWIGMGFAPADTKPETPQEKPEATSFIGFR